MYVDGEIIPIDEVPGEINSETTPVKLNPTTEFPEKTEQVTSSPQKPTESLLKKSTHRPLKSLRRNRPPARKPARQPHRRHLKALPKSRLPRPKKGLLPHGPPTPRPRAHPVHPGTHLHDRSRQPPKPQLPSLQPQHQNKPTKTRRSKQMAK